MYISVFLNYAFYNFVFYNVRISRRSQIFWYCYYKNKSKIILDLR